jgi:hypothetical protein
MTTTQTLTKLPASNITIPASDYHVTNVRTMQTLDGHAFTATLRLDKRIVANIQQDGNGGPTFAHWINHKAQSDFAAYVAQFDGKWGESVYEGGFDWDEESVIDHLVEEVILARELNRKYKKAILLLDAETTDPTEGYATIKGTTHEDPRLDRILAKFAPTTTHVWNGNEWAAR